MNLSFWEEETYFKNIDVVIIGSGIVGLNAALQIKLKKPKLKVVILERGILPAGASTKNAGFACFGSCTELLNDLKTNSEDKVFSLVEKRWMGLKRLKKNLGDKNIDYHKFGGYEIFDDENIFAESKAQIDFLNKKITEIIGIKKNYSITDSKIKEFGFKGIKHIIKNAAEGQIDTGKMMLALTKLVQHKGVIILNSVKIKNFNDDGKEVSISTETGYKIRSKRLIIATNGFAKQLQKNIDVTPARSQVLITTPIKNLRITGTFHYQQGYFYFRNIGNRVLLGGGRNLDFKGEETSEFGLSEIIQKKLEELLRSNILPNSNYTIEQRWSGIMGVGNTKQAIVKSLSKNVFCGVRMGGMGVAIGSLIGEEVAYLVIKSI